MVIYPRGSEWRRWDLHVHTPGTQKNDNYIGKSLEEKWDNFYKTVDDYIGDGHDSEKAISAIGITDYLSIENYKKVITDKRLNSCIDLILPNVELRMFPLAKKTPVNIHCIFNPSIVNELDNRFFAKLNFSYGESNYSATRSELIRLGRAIEGKSELDEVEAYKRGLLQFVIDISSLKSVFDTDKNLRENTIIVVSNNTDDGASGVTSHSDYFLGNGSSQTEAARREIYHISDLIFSAQESDKKYFLGQSSDDIETVIRKCGSIKGCIHGSDAHTNKDLFEPDGKRYCWIKADPTFNGLKQIIYEPDSRICISAVKPEEKPDYQVIDSISFGDTKVQDEKIFFNDKLTCIIGGKSTGKSLLLHNLAYSIDPDQVKEKAEIIHQKIDGRQLADVVVEWKDGTKTGDDEACEKKIVYIPQTYLNRLSDESEELTEIDEIIKNVVLIDPEAKIADLKMQEAFKMQKTTVERLIYEVSNAYTVIQDKKSEEAEVGSKIGIEKEIKKLNVLKKKLTNNGTITENEIAEYNTSISEFKRLDNMIIQLTEDIDFVNSLDSVVMRRSIGHKFEKDDLIDFNEMANIIVNEADQSWIVKKEDLVKKISNRRDNLKSMKAQYEANILIMKPKIEENESIKKITDSILAENEKLAKVIAFEQEIDALKKDFSMAVDNLIKEFFVYRSIRKEYEETINNKLSLNRDGLVFSVETPFRLDYFIDIIKGTIDNRSLRANREWINIDEISYDWITVDNMKHLVEECLCGNLKLLRKKTPENALREILSDWNNTTYRVSMDDDSIDGMSPGKKALVLLKLLINLAESKCPILIDQPEDDLDNRSVFEELIPFIKSKKVQRQIIVVTHNANVVLGGDAEEIIVANQHGKNSPNRNFKFEYRSGAIEEDRPEGNDSVLNRQGIQQHICEILEGGEQAFDLRKHKYHI